MLSDISKREHGLIFERGAHLCPPRKHAWHRLCDMSYPRAGGAGRGPKGGRERGAELQHAPAQTASGWHSGDAVRIIWKLPVLIFNSALLIRQLKPGRWRIDKYKCFNWWSEIWVSGCDCLLGFEGAKTARSFYAKHVTVKRCPTLQGR